MEIYESLLGKYSWLSVKKIHLLGSDILGIYVAMCAPITDSNPDYYPTCILGHRYLVLKGRTDIFNNFWPFGGKHTTIVK